jgi:nucleobase:cation symporter-1, NCS1 family
MIVSVPPTMPGLINSINTNIPVGVSTRLFDIAYLLGVGVPFSWIPTTIAELEILVFPDTTVPFTVQFTLASTIYFTLSRNFPAPETMLDHAILEQETLPLADDGNNSSDEKKIDDCRINETDVA